jgi:tetratricopeptide (TPR) repeat protein
MSMLGLELALAGALLAPGQAGTSVIVGESKTGAVLLGALVHDPRRVDEQIEVMRALLLRKLRGSEAGAPLAAYDAYHDMSTALLSNNYFVPTTTFQPTAGADGQAHYQPVTTYTATMGANPLAGRARAGGQPVEGVYVPGYGVVFTVTLPPPAQDPLPAAEAAKAPAALSEWDRTQRQLRGEWTFEHAPPPPKEPPLGEVLLRVLAENGKHFTALRDDEQLTVAVVFRGSRAAPRAANAPSTTQPANANVIGAMSGSVNIAGGGTHTFAGQNAPPPAQTARDLELLGDLHLKQGQSQQALEAYLKALTTLDAEWRKTDLNNADEDQLIAQFQRRIGDLYAKQAQAQLEAGRLDEARQLLDKAKASRERAGKSAAEKPAAAKPAGPTLPARLTISATKRLLDQVGSGTISFDEFRKAARIESVPATGAPDKPAAPPEKKAVR